MDRVRKRKETGWNNQVASIELNVFVCRGDKATGGIRVPVFFSYVMGITRQTGEKHDIEALFLIESAQIVLLVIIQLQAQLLRLLSVQREHDMLPRFHLKLGNINSLHPALGY